MNSYYLYGGIFVTVIIIIYILSRPKYPKWVGKWQDERKITLVINPDNTFESGDMKGRYQVITENNLVAVTYQNGSLGKFIYNPKTDTLTLDTKGLPGPAGSALPNVFKRI